MNKEAERNNIRRWTIGPPDPTSPPKHPPKKCHLVKKLAFG